MQYADSPWANPVKRKRMLEEIRQMQSSGFDMAAAPHTAQAKALVVTIEPSGIATFLRGVPVWPLMELQPITAIDFYRESSRTKAAKAEGKPQ